MSSSQRGGASRTSGFVAAGAFLALVGGPRCTPIADVSSAPATQHADAAIGDDTSDSSCSDDSDCPVPSVCASVSCLHGVCVTSALRAGMVLPDAQQVPGDCQRVVCDRRGVERSEPDDSDNAASEGDPCHTISCSGGVASSADREDGASCNGSGVCKAGVCSICVDGKDCTDAKDCTVHRLRCSDGRSSCEDTGVPAPSKACDVGKICDRGVCSACVVGDACTVDDVCQVGRVASCDGARVCDVKPRSGNVCGLDESGNPMFCLAGACMAPCQEGPCVSASDACQTSRWDCPLAGAPRCVKTANADGIACGDDASCREGVCVHAVLSNGAFQRGLSGWAASGDAAKFFVAADGKGDDRSWVSTAANGQSASDTLTGTLSQQFTVPKDALAIRFLVFGGHAHVRLRDDLGNALEDCVALDSNTTRIPVSWDLSARRGQHLTIALEDDLSDGPWAFVSTSGFDIVRDLPGPLRNAQFANDLSGWDSSGDGAHFAVYEDYNYSTGRDALNTGVSAYGRRRSVTTYVQDLVASRIAEASVGTLSQVFVVPSDAMALRFNLCGGRRARVLLLDGTSEVYSASANDDDSVKVPITWDLINQRGKMLRLSVEDTVTGSFGYIGTSGFDLITSYNGP